MGELQGRARKKQETRERVARAALDLFVTGGFAATSIDQIADAARVGRRTVFRHFATKEAILFDQLAAGRDFAVRELARRPLDEPPLASLHVVLRELCLQGYDRRLLVQIRRVVEADPQFAGRQLSVDIHAFEQNLVSTLQERLPNSAEELLALTGMAESWFRSAVRLYFQRGEKTLLEYFDEVVHACLAAGSRELIRPRPTHSAEVAAPL